MTEVQKQHILEKATTLARGRGLEVLHFTARGSDARPVLEIVLDGPRAVGLEDCESISKALDTEIETFLNSNINYRLDVLSPGIEEPIKYDYQLERSIGKSLEITFTKEEKPITTHGLLESYTDKELTIIERKTMKKGQPVKTGEKKTIKRASITKLHQVVVF